mmetsp:Transcript_2061/g.6522  ORF Transcript_2061/g.6522 Transcript_2061/m.6522 type:complete len:242 (-) Transcript_2061:76-801(-)
MSGTPEPRYATRWTACALASLECCTPNTVSSCRSALRKHTFAVAICSVPNIGSSSIPRAVSQDSSATPTRGTTLTRPFSPRAVAFISSSMSVPAVCPAGRNGSLRNLLPAAQPGCTQSQSRTKKAPGFWISKLMSNNTIVIFTFGLGRFLLCVCSLSQQQSEFESWQQCVLDDIVHEATDRLLCGGAIRIAHTEAKRATERHRGDQEEGKRRTGAHRPVKLLKVGKTCLIVTEAGQWCGGH